MSMNGQDRGASDSSSVLRWSGHVVTAEDLRQSLNGHRELIVTPRTVITPLAADHLKANGVHLVRQDELAKPQATDHEKSRMAWGYMMERPDSVIQNVVQSLARDGVQLQEISVTSRRSSAARADEECETLACGLARQAAEIVAGGQCRGVVVFCPDPGLTCCVANKVKGIRAVAIATATQVGCAAKGWGINFLALEPGRSTFFELRQILRGVCSGPVACPDRVAEVFRLLEEPCQCHHSDLNPGQRPELKEECRCGGGHAHR